MIQTAKQVKDDKKSSIQKQITKSLTIEEGIKQLFPNYKFSMEQIMTTLSFLSRITSSSYSFHPAAILQSRLHVSWNIQDLELQSF